jgi:hypothetical protein
MHLTVDTLIDSRSGHRLFSETVSVFQSFSTESPSKDTPPYDEDTIGEAPIAG